jgi:AcrR family transcriptional regulator
MHPSRRRPRLTSARALRWERRPDARVPELLDAALHVFAELGYRGTRLDAVAERAGVTKGTIYHYFDTKEELLLAVIEHYQAIAFERIDEILRDATLGEAERLKAIVRGIFARRRAGRPLLAVLIRTVPIELPRVHEQWLREGPVRLSAIIAGVIERGQKSGEFNRSLAAAPAARQLVAGLLLQLIWTQHGGSIRALAVDEGVIVDNALGGLLLALRPG